MLDSFDPHALDWVFSGLDVSDEGSVQDAMRELGRVIGRLQSLATGRLAVAREMRELEKRLGLDPKALAELRWTIVDDTAPVSKPAASAAPRLRAV